MLCASPLLDFSGRLLTAMGALGGRLRRIIRDRRGISVVEVLIAALLLGIASAGVTLMFGSGQAFIVGEGDNRVALALARQAIEQVRASGFGPTSGRDPGEELKFHSTAYGQAHPG